ncbi:MAG TPA: hypothetical protein VLA52_00035 [Thermohalobaculum sp.]|nr:hypothetical protein [Thermohalobaculum sp.]
MLMRLAIFEGTVKPGQEEAFRAYVDRRLAPLWRKFDGAAEVRVLKGAEHDASAMPIPLILAITYPDRAAMERALASPARYESRDLLPELFEKYFDGRMHHHLMTVE